MASELQPNDLDNLIVNLVQKFWKEHGRPLLLSQLGGRESGWIAKRAKEEAGGLGTYLRHRLSDRVKVIQHSANPTIVGAIPADEDIPGSTDDLLNQTQTQSDRTTLRFHPAFWAAFRKHLDHSMQRYLSIQPPIYFRDVVQEIQEMQQSSGFLEIEREYIADPDDDTATVEQKINTWLAENHLHANVFGRDRMTDGLPADDLLGRMLLALEPDELKRMSIPLDIVRKLRSRSL